MGLATGVFVIFPAVAVLVFFVDKACCLNCGIVRIIIPVRRRFFRINQQRYLFEGFAVTSDLRINNVR